MIRREFLDKALKTSLGVLALPTMAATWNNEVEQLDLPVYDGKVIIVGAGAAGLMAGYLLQKNNIKFQILEASDSIGGRVKKLSGFADFPIDIGAEWIHTNPKILRRLLGRPRQEVPIDIIDYNPREIFIAQNGQLKDASYYRHYYSEYKFKSTTWFDYLNEYIAPNIKEKITLNTPVKKINYNASKVNLMDANGKAYHCDKVLVTVPVTILQKNLIEFVPALPPEKIIAINKVDMPLGIKVFIAFSEKFYPDVVVGDLEAMNNKEYYKTYYDVAFKKETKKNVLGLLATGYTAKKYIALNDDQIIKEILKELDELFGGKASKSYQKHFIQNWSKQPYIQGSYSHFGKKSKRIIRQLVKPVDEKVYFAGEAMNLRGHTATVHGAALSARDVLKHMFS